MCVCYLCVCVCVCVCVRVLTINSGVDVSGLPSFASIRHCNTIYFDTRRTSYLKEPPAISLKTYLKDNGNIFFVAIKGILIKLMLEIKSSFPSHQIST